MRLIQPCAALFFVFLAGIGADGVSGQDSLATFPPDRPDPALSDGAEGEDATLPVPVLLVPGWGDAAPELASLRARFIEAGWPPGRVAAVTFRDPVGSSRIHADEVADEVRALREASGSRFVDVVAHSMGGLAVRYFLRFGDPQAADGVDAGGVQGSPGPVTSDSGPRDRTPVRKVVFLGTPHRGTVAAFVAWGPGGDEMEPGSPFLDSLNAGPFVPPSMDALAVRTPVDLRVVPGESAMLPEAANTRNVELCCPTHAGLLDDAETFRVVLEFLTGR